MDPQARSTWARFPSSTHVWKLLARLRESEEPERSAELSELVELYWRPVYGFLRRHGQPRQDAEDLVQSFFAKLIEKGWVERASPEKGRFRTFLRTLLIRFVRDAKDLRQGRFERAIVSWDALQAAAPPLELRAGESPEDTFGRMWAQDLLARTWTTFEESCRSDGHEESARALSAWLDASSEGRPLFEVIGAEIGLEGGEVRKALDRARKVYRESLRAEVRRTLPDGATDEEVDQEIAELPGMLSIED